RRRIVDGLDALHDDARAADARRPVAPAALTPLREPVQQREKRSACEHRRNRHRLEIRPLANLRTRDDYVRKVFRIERLAHDAVHAMRTEAFYGRAIAAGDDQDDGLRRELIALDRLENAETIEHRHQQ